ncbi:MULTISPECIES: hypothetical protein [unclassified Nocardioides]|uniref:hypothetical protein n=1 Tax=unclassified Nocardioides TaxID=2615069 RepID=UPI0006F9478E|nr:MULTISPECIES: hypothetical protein [unclassified Nocardioides]KQY55512.1 hypothetical protein ASD30_16575 [Nocardioides sp. Root140]KRF12751.1 hypothetical protein ASH02_14550 [Nocardioides sp. Soil796]
MSNDAGFGVRPPALRDAAGAIAGAAEQLGALAPASALSRIERGLPGSASAAAARDLARVWRRGYAEWEAAARRHGVALRAGADDYEAVDARAAARLESRGSRDPLDR